MLVMGMLLMSTGIVAADGQPTDPQPGFGVAIAIAAILVAIYLARRRRSAMPDNSSATDAPEDGAETDGGI